MNIRPLISVIIAASLLGGCSSIPKTESRPGTDSYVTEAFGNSGWDATPAITRSGKKSSISILDPLKIPDAILNSPISVESSGHLSPEDLVFVFGEAGLQAAVAGRSVEKEEQASIQDKVYVPTFNGSVGSFIDLISATTDLTFSWSGSGMIIGTERHYIVRVTQHKDVVTSIADSIRSMGGERVNASKESGSISYTASNLSQMAIGSYLSEISKNTAVINTQIMVLKVSIEDQTNQGFDWSKLEFNFGDDLAEPVTGKGFLGSITGNGLGVAFSDSSTSVVAALNMLSEYGESKISQNISISTISGLSTTVRSGGEIPYISEINSTADEGVSSSGVTTDVVKTGLTINLEPIYSADEEAITLDLEMLLKSLDQFRDLSAGNQLGELSLPQISEHSLKNIVKVQAGESIMLGGLIVDDTSDQRKNLSLIKSLPTGSKDYERKQEAIFFLLRPTVTVFGGGES